MADVNKDTIQGIKDKFDAFKINYEQGLGLLIGIAENMNDEARRQQLWDSYRLMGGRTANETLLSQLEARINEVLGRFN